jgi:hypothetical protein
VEPDVEEDGESGISYGAAAYGAAAAGESAEDVEDGDSADGAEEGGLADRMDSTNAWISRLSSKCAGVRDVEKDRRGRGAGLLAEGRERGRAVVVVEPPRAEEDRLLVLVERDEGTGRTWVKWVRSSSMALEMRPDRMCVLMSVPI